MADRPRLTEDDELTPLGASAPVTLTKGRDSKAGSGGGRDGRPPRRSRRTMAVLALPIVVVVALVPALASGLKKTPRDRVGISYGGGPIEGSHFQRIVQPGSTLFFNGLFDPLYLYPADQQNYIVSKAKGQGSTKGVDSIVAPTNDEVQIEYQVAAYFKLNTDRLRQFHEQLGLKYRAYTAAGWVNLVQDTFRQQIENALQRETRRYSVADLFSSAARLTQLQSDVQASIARQLVTALGGRFFCGPTFRPGGTCADPTFIIKKIDIPASVVMAFEANRNASVQIETRQKEAKAIEALNKALAQAGQNYVLLRAVESGNVKMWIIPNGTGINISPDGQVAGGPSGTGGGTSPSSTTTTAPAAGR